MARTNKLFLLLVLLLFLFPFSAAAQKPAAGLPLQAAFVRDGQLWLKMGTNETQLTPDGKASSPQWSHDGRWISYYKDGNLWVYDRMNTNHFQIASKEKYSEIRNEQWAPNKNIIAWQSHISSLAVTDLQSGKPPAIPNYLSEGVGQYAWLPDGSGFLGSSSARLLPDGWTKIALYKIPLSSTLGSNNQGVRFFTLPGTLTKGNIEVWSIGTSTFKWSEDGKWVAFIVHPTASWSADSNMLCVLSMDEKRFEALDEMLDNEEWFAWAPRKNALGYIAGSGRFATQNKDLKVQELPAWHSVTLTPNRFVDTAFTWHSVDLLTVVRAPESKDYTSQEQRPKPVLYQVNLPAQTQSQISTPPAGFGDYDPHFIRRSQQLTWVRSDRQQTSVWVANPDGSEAREWIGKLGAGTNYYEQRNFSNVLSVYGAKY